MSTVTVGKKNLIIGDNFVVTIVPKDARGTVLVGVLRATSIIINAVVQQCTYEVLSGIIHFYVH